MATNSPKSGANNAPQYQMSGIPFVTSSVADEVKGVHNASASPAPVNINFDYVTKWIEIENTDATNGLRVAFTGRGAFGASERLPVAGSKSATDLGNYFIIATGQKVRYDFRCKSLFFVSNAAASGTPEASNKSSGFSLRAGLTTIPAANFPILTGSITGSATPSFPDGVLSAFDGVG